MTCPMCDDRGTKDYASFAMEPCDHRRPFVAPRPEAGELHTAYLTRVVQAFEEWANRALDHISARRSLASAVAADVPAHAACGIPRDKQEWRCATGHKDFCPLYRQSTARPA